MPRREFSEGEVRYEGAVIPYTLRRSKRRRKTLQITVGSDGVRVAVPFRTPKKQVQELVLNRAPWIMKQLDKQKERPTPKKFATGETMPYLGRILRLVVEKQDVKDARVRFNHWRFLVDAPESLEGDALQEEIRRAFLEWYRVRATQRAAEGVNLWWRIMGRGKKPRIIIGNQRSLWGSCAADGTLRFNWRLVMMPPSLMEYVVVHELAHLKVRNHSAAFWKVVNRALPDATQRRLELREAGRSLPL